MTKWILLALLTLLAAPNGVFAETCYYEVDNVGCDPEGYGYPEDGCPSTCTGEEAYGCEENGVIDNYFLDHGPDFDTLDVQIFVETEEELGDKLALAGDESADGVFRVCTYEGSCDCEIFSDGQVVLFTVCKKIDEFVWEDWLMPYSHSGCTDIITNDDEYDDYDE